MKNIRHIIQEYHTFLKMKLSLDISDVWVDDYINEIRDCECESKLSDRSIRLKELYREEQSLGAFREIDLLIQEYEKDIHALKSNIIDNLDSYDNGYKDGNKAG